MGPLRIALFTLLAVAPSLSAQDNVGQCRDCHRNGGHANAGDSNCKVCGEYAGPACCARSHCFDGKCKDCGKEFKSELSELIDALSDASKRADAAKKIEKIGRKAVSKLKAAREKAQEETKAAIEKLLDLLDWPEGGKIIDGLQMTLKAAQDKHKVGDIVELKVRITNTTDREWSKELQLHSVGFEGHLVWKGTLPNGLPTAELDVMAFECCKPGNVTLKIPAGSHQVYTLRAAEPPRKNRGRLCSGPVSIGTLQISKIAEQEGTWLIRISEMLLGLQSNETKVIVEK